MQIQKINSSQNQNQNFSGLLKVSEEVTLIPEEILSGVHYGKVRPEYSQNDMVGQFIIYKNPFGVGKMAISLTEVNNEVLARIARARSTISDKVEDISEFVGSIFKVDEKV